MNKFTMILPPAFTLFASAVAPDSALLSALANAGGLGILSGVLLYLHVTQHREHREDMKQHKTDTVAALAGVKQSLDELVEKLD